MSFREEHFGRSRAQVVIYDWLRVVARSIMPALFRIRAIGRDHYPPTGGGLVCANHQSHFDPIVVGLTCDRRLNYVARKSLFRFPLNKIIEFLDAIPIEREGIGIGGLKATLKRLKRGELVLIFPEGTRTRNGEIGKIRAGFCTLARRAKVPVIPVAFDGSFQAWPRWRRYPTWSAIVVCIGQPITPEEVADMDDDELVAELDRRLRAEFQKARRIRR